MFKWMIRLSGFFALAILWQLTSLALNNPIMPPLTDIITTLFQLIITSEYQDNIFSSFGLIVAGVAVAVCAGFLLSLLICRYETFKIAAQPIVESVRGIAALTLFPLLIVSLGIGSTSRIFVIFWTAWPAVVLSTITGLDIDQSIVEAAKLDGADEWTIILKIKVPIASQEIMTGVRIGVSGGWISLVAAEMLGATKGLGYFLLWSSQSFRFSEVYATIIVIAGIGGIINLFLSVLQNMMKV